jgi:hypothetical protein
VGQSDLGASLAPYRHVWLVWFQYQQLPGAQPVSVCCAALELRTGRLVRQWLWGDKASVPYKGGRDALFISFDVPAQLACHPALGWAMPAHVLDLSAEYKRCINGRWPILIDNLIGPVLDHGLDAAEAVDHQAVRNLAQRGERYTPAEQCLLLDACEQRVRLLAKLLLAMLRKIDLPQALFRGRYLAAEGRILYNGIPIDTERLQILEDSWADLKQRLIADAGPDQYLWRNGYFQEEAWQAWVMAHRLPWPRRRRSSELCLSDEVFRVMAKRYPHVEPVRALRALLAQLPDFELPVGPDGRTRCPPGAFGTITGRCAPRGRDAIFLRPAWCRGLIQAPPGRGLVLLDFAQQEYLVAAVLSGDAALLADYRAGDCYLALGKSLRLIPAWGTGETHSSQRDVCKAITLAVLYGMQPPGLARRIQGSVTVAADLLRRHRQKYARFWRWSDGTVDFAHAYGYLQTRYGWRMHVAQGVKNTTLRNWRVQATGAEVLRAAVCALDGAGISMDATLHDAVLIEADAAVIDAVALKAERLMVRASAAVLGEPLRVQKRVLRPGDRLLEGRKARATWERIWGLLDEGERAMMGGHVRAGPLSPVA